jgi:hypothetical protein
MAIPCYYKQDTLKFFETVRIWNCGSCSITKDIINHAQKQAALFFLFVSIDFYFMMIAVTMH